MNESFIKRFVLRWLIGSLGFWITAGLLSSGINYGERWEVILVAGFLLAIVNSIIKPIIVILSLPAILLSLGLFMIVINGFMVMLVSWIYPGLEVTNFWAAMLAGMIIGLVNYLVMTVLESRSNA